MKLIPWFSILFLGSAAAPALAGSAFELVIDAGKARAAKTAKGPDNEACAGSVTPSEDGADQLVVRITEKLRFALTISAGGQTATLGAGKLEAKLPAGAFANDKVLVMSQGTLICERMLAAAPAPVPTPPKPDERKAPPAGGPVVVSREQTSFATLDELAREFLGQKQITEHELVKDSVLGRRLRLYHLPSGAPAFPIPRHLDEKDEVELWIVLPEGAVAKVEVTACEDAPAVRVAGTYKASADAIAKLTPQSAEEERAPAPKLAFRLEPHAKRLSCAKTLTYQIEVKRGGEQASTPTSIDFDPVYRFEWGVGFMFDFGKRTSYSLGDRPRGTGSEKFLVESRDAAGASVVLALGVNPCGTNPKALNWCDRFFTPTLLLDPSRLSSGFGLGMTFRPFSGIGLLAGVTVFESTVLADGVTVDPGETWSIAGDPPTKSVFNRDSLGFVLAAIVSTDVLAALSRIGD